MAYNTEIFERAAHACGYVIESIRKSSPNTVESVKGSVVEGTLVKQVRWNAEGKCFSYRCNPLPKYDLPLEEVSANLFNVI